MRTTFVSSRDALNRLRKRRYIAALVAHGVVLAATVAVFFAIHGSFDDWVRDVLVVWAVGYIAHVGAVIFVGLTDSELLTDAERSDEVWTRSVFIETEAMIRWAAASGRQVPSGPAIAVAEFRRNHPELFESDLAEGFGLTSGQAVRAHRAEQARLWAIPPSSESVRGLMAAHRQMTKLVAPASPRSVRLIYYGRRNRLVPFLGSIKLIRHMALVSVALLTLVVGLTIAGDPFEEPPASLAEEAEAAADELASAAEDLAGAVDESTADEAQSDAVDAVVEEAAAAADSISAAIEEAEADAAAEPAETDVAPEVVDTLGETATSRAASVVYLLATAGLGAAFFAMWKANSYVQRAVYDPIYEPTYWIRFILGVVGGFVLAVVIRSAFPDLSQFGPPVLAIVGGFSADVVYRILERIAETVDTLVRGSAKNRVDAQRRANAAQAAAEEAEVRMALAVQLVHLQNVLNEEGTAGGQEQVAVMLNELLPQQGAADAPPVVGRDADPEETDVRRAAKPLPEDEVADRLGEEESE